jgi:hypothetical protein
VPVRAAHARGADGDDDTVLGTARFGHLRDRGPGAVVGVDDSKH